MLQGTQTDRQTGSVARVAKVARYRERFPKEGNFIGEKCLRGRCVFYGLFEWKESAGHVLRKIVSHTTV